MEAGPGAAAGPSCGGPEKGPKSCKDAAEQELTGLYTLHTTRFWNMGHQGQACIPHLGPKEGPKHSLVSINLAHSWPGSESQNPEPLEPTRWPP